MQKEIIETDMFREPTFTDTTIHLNSNYPIEEKLAVYKHLTSLFTTTKTEKINTIMQIAQHNGYPSNILQNYI
jgi:hypothetical protein